MMIALREVNNYGQGQVGSPGLEFAVTGDVVAVLEGGDDDDLNRDLRL